MRILCIPYSHTISHISRPLLIAKELRHRGHEILFAGESPKIKFIQQEGFNVLPVLETVPDMLYGNIRKGKLRFVSDAEVEKLIEADLTLFKGVKPDLVLTDGRFTTMISTYIAGLKHAAIVNASSTEYRALPYIPFFEWILPRGVKRDGGLWKQLDVLNIRLEMFVFDNIMNIFKILSKRYDLPKMITATNCLTGKDLTLLADIPEYFPTRNLPDNYHYIGPLTWKSDFPAPSWWPPKRGVKPLIYITMGTTGVSDFFHRAYKLFKASGMAAVITTGAQTEAPRTVEGTIYVEPFLDGDLVMEECALVVCHGGNGTIYQALQHGKPVIGIPTIPDQKFNMRRVETLGIGRTLQWKEFTKNPASLIHLIKAMMGNVTFYQEATRVSQVIRKYDAVKTAADLILDLI